MLQKMDYRESQPVSSTVGKDVCIKEDMAKLSLISAALTLKTVINLPSDGLKKYNVSTVVDY
jgi:hypothetical protein